MPRFIPRGSIRAYILALVGLTILPLIAFSLYLLYSIQASERARLGRIVEREAATVAARTAQQLRDMLLTLRLLESAPELDAHDFRGFHARAQAALDSSRYFLIAVSADGQQLLNTRVDFGTALGKTADPETFAAAIAEARPIVSGAFFGRVAQEKVFNVVLPLLPDAAPAAALILTENASALSSTLNVEPLFPAWAWGVVDGSRAFVVSTGEVREEENAAVEGLSSSASLAGFSRQGDHLIGFSPVLGSNWSALVWGPIENASIAGEKEWWLLGIGGAAAFLVALLGGAIIGRRLQNDVTELSAMARQIGDGKVIPPVTSPIKEISSVADVMSEASFDRSEAEERLYVLSRELVHRTKNLLAVVQAIISQTGKSAESMVEFKEAVTSRIAGLAQSIDLMVSHTEKGVSLAALIERQLSVFSSDHQQVEIRGKDFILGNEAAQTLGMVFHELATNATKYGALSTPTGKIVIAWNETANDDGDCILEISWTETAGPRPKEPAREGFGTFVIKRNVETVFRAMVSMDYLESGFVWRMKGQKTLLAYDAKHMDEIPS